MKCLDCPIPSSRTGGATLGVSGSHSWTTEASASLVVVPTEVEA